ncbi:hypothetical protein BAY32_15730 [Elizabethkingia ursingii]|uniref:Uncharacterized protein n=1 Tax=Elizabethkingia ursingii TaxID=1756150 RepID=A0AAJ3TQM9_9FLAO|nr:hypothetical protein BAY32_15730 [Elizabethkingia ursingii]
MFHSLQIKGGKINHKYRNTNYYNKVAFLTHIQKENQLFIIPRKPDNPNHIILHLSPKTRSIGTILIKFNIWRVRYFIFSKALLLHYF